MSSNGTNDYLPGRHIFFLHYLLSDSLLAGIDLFLTFRNQSFTQLSPNAAAFQPCSLSQRNGVEGAIGTLEVVETASPLKKTVSNISFLNT